MPESISKPLVLLLGVTGSGKSAAAMELADALKAEIVSVDSMQVYRRMDIGTAKPTRAERERVPHHLVDVVEPWESFSAARFAETADAAIRDIFARGQTPLVVGGTPLYLMSLMFGMFEGPSADAAVRDEFRKRADADGVAVLHGELAAVDPEAAARIHPNDYKRIERALEVHRLTGRPLSEQQGQWVSGQLRYPSIVVGIRREKEDASRRINARVHQMMEAGLVEEVRGLLADSRGMSAQARQAVGYAEIIAYLGGRWKLEEAVERIKINTRRLAKHQRTWYRRFPMAEWADVAAEESADTVVARLIESIRQASK
ncbi:MAG TPA: tRNA (adenosine(37)-N6)-dimethylallyltransferase MiaA [Phycisphaerae bacterium]|nr:tRNA (adenosine(37)-N6)-dimethylallyltransferase MiaA [Phycisphaerae bacterium]